MINNEELRWAIARQVSDWVGFECEAGECLPQADSILASAWLAADRKAQRAEALTDFANWVFDKDIEDCSEVIQEALARADQLEGAQ